jgi:hypothetical protein
MVIASDGTRASSRGANSPLIPDETASWNCEQTCYREREIAMSDGSGNVGSGFDRHATGRQLAAGQHSVMLWLMHESIS